MSPSDATQSLDRPSGLLPVDPPACAARWTGWLLLALAIAGLAFGVFFRLPETVVAPFVLVPEGGAEPVQAPIAGELAAVHIRAGQTVRAGAALFELRSDAVRDAHVRLASAEAELRTLGELTQNRETAHRAALHGHDAALALAKRELTAREEHLAAARRILAVLEGLAAKGQSSQLEVLAQQLSAADSEQARVLAELRGEQLALERGDLVLGRERDRGAERAAAEKLTLEIAALRERLDGSVGDRRTVRAPFDAVVLRVSRPAPDGVVEAGAELAQLARTGARLQARLDLPENGLAKLRAGQPARLFFTAFPYQRHGALRADLVWVSPASITDRSQAGFVALADLVPIAADGPLVQAGMNGQARVLVGRRTLLELALEPMRALRERAFVEPPARVD